MMLLHIGHLVDALNPLLQTSDCSEDVSRIVDQGVVRPFAYFGQIPLFALPQIGEVALALTGEHARRQRTTRGRRGGSPCKL